MKAHNLFLALATSVCLLFAGLAAGCRTSSAVSVDPERSLQDRYNSLAEVVRNLPNVQVTGESVVYRGVSSLNGSNEMQFLVGDVLLPSMSQAEALYPLHSIRAVRIVPPTDAISRFGMRASAGIVELILIN